MTDIIQLEKERFAWSKEMFPETTPIQMLRKLESEIKEIEDDINSDFRNPLEYADALMCLFDSAGRNGISVEQIFQAFDIKLSMNKQRKWKKNEDGTYSHIRFAKNLT